jgi:hypothetical protein
VRPELRRFGNGQFPVVIIDDFLGDPNRVVGIAAELGGYFANGHLYPGVRRVITNVDQVASAYVTDVCERAAQFIGGAFEIDSFDLLEASFSIVTTPPSDLTPPQRAPHFDTTDQKHLAILHYLNVPARSGTAFYRQRSTGIERVTESNIGLFVGMAKNEAAALAPDSGYINGSDDYFEQIAAIEAVPDRLIIYQGSLLHSGIIPADMTFSADPREGRLTANLFVRGH